MARLSGRYRCHASVTVRVLRIDGFMVAMLLFLEYKVLGKSCH